MRLAITSVLGLIFGLGLYLGGMTQPSKVLGFLDILGLWDPSLAFVMAGAIAVGIISFRLARQRERSYSGGPALQPSARSVDRKLIVGATIFGVGWGLSGVCPGPAIFNLGVFDPQSQLFFISMVAGIALERLTAFTAELIQSSRLA